jgi:hypothetical protein
VWYIFNKYRGREGDYENLLSGSNVVLWTRKRTPLESSHIHVPPMELPVVMTF